RQNPGRHVSPPALAPYRRARGGHNPAPAPRGAGPPPPAPPGGAPPRYAEHTEEILTEAGLGPERIARLRDSGVLPRAP
ncbi:hypothetical protein LWS69_32640, partial [Bordetella hinzii]|nr:hypothetical protein [Bordetella hinzii]